MTLMQVFKTNPRVCRVNEAQVAWISGLNNCPALTSRQRPLPGIGQGPFRLHCKQFNWRLQPLSPNAWRPEVSTKSKTRVEDRQRECLAKVSANVSHGLPGVLRIPSPTRLLGIPIASVPRRASKISRQHSAWALGITPTSQRLPSRSRPQRRPGYGGWHSRTFRVRPSGMVGPPGPGPG